MGWRQAIALVAACGQLAASEVHLRWGEVRPSISGKTVTVVTRDGQRPQGKVLDRGPEAVAVEARGSATLVRGDAVSTIEVAPRGGKLRGVMAGVGTAVAGTALCPLAWERWPAYERAANRRTKSPSSST